jgi:hypothetical protein
VEADGQFFQCSVQDPVVLLGDDDSSGSEAEGHGCGLRGENAPAYEGFFDSPEAAID